MPPAARLAHEVSPGQQREGPRLFIWLPIWAGRGELAP